MDFWERLDLLIEKRSSRKAVAAECGFAVNSIPTWIGRRNYPRADLALKLAQVLGVSVEYLLTGRDKNIRPCPERVKKMCADLDLLPSEELALMATMIHAAAEKYRHKAHEAGVG